MMEEQDGKRVRAEEQDGRHAKAEKESECVRAEEKGGRSESRRCARAGEQGGGVCEDGRAGHNVFE